MTKDEFSAGEFSAGEFSAGEFRAGEFRAGELSAQDYWATPAVEQDPEPVPASVTDQAGQGEHAGIGELAAADQSADGGDAGTAELTALLAARMRRIEAGHSEVSAPDEPTEAADDEVQRAREIGMRRLSLRPHSRRELHDAMIAKGISVEVADALLDRYEEVQLIDDAAFARAWVDSRHTSRGLSRRVLAGELRRKGIADEALDEAVSQISADDEYTAALAIARKKMRTLAGHPREVQQRRLYGVLARRGFAAPLVMRLVNDLTGRDAQLDSGQD